MLPEKVCPSIKEQIKAEAEDKVKAEAKAKKKKAKTKGANRGKKLSKETKETKKRISDARNKR